jgi:hydroxymethylpyrimidine/phosphomethylpyrimidine kinase
MTPIALTIAGSDPAGGAGLQADLKTFHQFGIFGATVATLITVQNTVRLSRIETLSADLVGDQLDAVLEDLTPAAIKTGALGTPAVVEAIAARHFPCPLVVDPVMTGKHGGALMDNDARSAFRNLLLPKATLVTPNLDEASALSNVHVHDPATMREAARRIADLGAKSVLVKGGHLPTETERELIDILWHDGAFQEFRAPRLATKQTHGTGCVYSAAIAAGLASGLPLPDAVGRAKRFLRKAIETAPGIGSGQGPLNLFVPPDPL